MANKITVDPNTNTISVASGGIQDHTKLTNIGTNDHDTIDAHLANEENPHGVTKAQVGLGNADNTSDANKPVSTAQQTALDLKVDKAANLIHVYTKADLPAPSGNVITLATDDITYLIYGPIDLTADRINITATGVTLRGVVSNAGFTSTTTGNLITGIASNNYNMLALVGLSAAWLIHQIDGGASGLFFHRVAFVGGATTRGLHCENYTNCVLTLCAFVSGMDGIELAGTVDNMVVDFCRFEEGITGTHIDYNGATVIATTVSNCAVVLSATSTFIEVAADGGNILAAGGGTITNNKINATLGGTAITGYSPLDLKWTAVGNNIIITSDRLQPTGWAFYDDGDTVTQTAPALEANAIKFSVDGLGPNTEEAFEPKVIRGVASLWDVATDDILPITSGDSYMIRLAFTLTAKSGNPSFLAITLDIGATGGVTIPVAQLSVVTPNSFPRNVMIAIPIFSLATFLANGGQILMYTDAGSIDVEERSIFIERISSGAS